MKEDTGPDRTWYLSKPTAGEPAGLVQPSVASPGAPTSGELMYAILGLDLVERWIFGTGASKEWLTAPVPNDGADLVAAGALRWVNTTGRSKTVARSADELTILDASPGLRGGLISFAKNVAIDGLGLSVEWLGPSLEVSSDLRFVGAWGGQSLVLRQVSGKYGAIWPLGYALGAASDPMLPSKRYVRNSLRISDLSPAAYARLRRIAEARGVRSKINEKRIAIDSGDEPYLLNELIQISLDEHQAFVRRVVEVRGIDPFGEVPG